MKKKCLTATAINGVFNQNATRRDIFDLAPGTCSNLPFSYFRLTLPRSPYLIAQKALFVAESFKGMNKVLNTGLRQLKINSIYYGDVFDPLTRSKSLILFKLMHGANSYTVYLFNGYYPKSLTKVINEIL